ncbi:MAG: Crp/Fnr family transcriptional regulator [Firmicutes bacterium]|nr:Crp/Fnr family transcriptional regulator [Bacillota bacterium]
MYQNLFIEDQQALMRDYFLNNLSKYGVVKRYNKKQFIAADFYDLSIGIVVEGQVIVSVVSSKGQEKILYTLLPGECFGEMNLISNSFFNYVIRVKKDATISFIGKDAFSDFAQKDTKVYQYFMNVMIIKFRIVLLQMVSNVFNNSTGKVADTLIRLISTSNSLQIEKTNNMVVVPFTQGELANIVGCSRITVTRILNQFIEQDLISMSNKKIVIKNFDGLMKQVIHV